MTRVGVAQATVTSPAMTSAAQSEPFGSISGTVVDQDGAGIAGAKVTLTTALPAGTRTVVADERGVFMFTDVPAQSYKIGVSAKGFVMAASTGVLNAGQNLILKPVTLNAAMSESINVTPMTIEEIAEEEVHAEEQQKIVGAIPNYFVTYNWNAVPLTAKQKWNLTWHTMISPVNLVLDGGTAGIEQAENDLKGYGQGASGYAKRYGAASGDFLSGTVLGGAVFPVLFHQDPRYFYKGTGSVMSRALYALSTAVICKGDNGKWQPSYSGVAGDMTAGALSNLYYPQSDRHGWQLTIENGLISAGTDGLQNLVQEFLLRHLTPHVQP